MASTTSSERPLKAEAVIDPDLPICDAHHHIMDHPSWTYSLTDFQKDLDDGHRVVSTVLIEAGSFYRKSGPDHLRPVGETEFALTLLQGTAGTGTAVSKAIVPFADLTMGARTVELLDAHAEAGGRAFRGIRQNATRDAAKELHSGYLEAGPELYERPDFRAGAAELAKRDLSFEAWQYYHQLPVLAEFARAVPDLRIVVNHVGGLLAVGPYAGRQDEILSAWRAGIAELAELPNVWMKLGGLGMGISFAETPGEGGKARSEELADLWSPAMHACIEAFGPERCMFESNFPIDRHSCSYRTIWNALKRVASGASADEKALLFHDTAADFYRIAN